MSTLNLITLPIGNKEDITLRALKELERISIFYAEDTRVFKEFLQLVGIDFHNKKIDSFHNYSEQKIERIISLIKDGHEVALVSDAGSPVISDPAYPLLKAAKDNNIIIKSCPGVTSVVTALELSALPSNPFHFWGFLARSSNEKLRFFNSLSSIYGTHIFFESPHRIFETIRLFFNSFPELELVVTRELTKKFEEVVRININNLNSIDSLVKDKGEFVLLFNIENVKQNHLSEDLKNEVYNYINQGGNTKKLCKIFAKITDMSTQEIYAKISRSKQDN